LAISEQITLIRPSPTTRVTRAVTHVLDDLVVAVLDVELSLIERRMLEFAKAISCTS
jgi:hypothetical protein